MWTCQTLAMSTVMLCTDGSDAALQAILSGVRQLGPSDRTLLVTVLDVLDPTLVTGVSGFGSGSMSPEQFARLDADRRAEADALLAETARRAGLGPVEMRALDGPAGPAICELAEAEGVEVIVMGSRGRGGLRRAMLGSVSDHVIRHAPCSVLVTSTHAERHQQS